MIKNGTARWIMASVAILINFGGVVWFAAVVATNGAAMQKDIAEIKKDTKITSNALIKHMAQDGAWTDAHDKQHERNPCEDKD